MRSFTIPIRTPSLTNQREHWRARHKRAARQRRDVGLLWRATTSRSDCVNLATRGGVIKLTRVSCRQLDDDNLRGALKSVRDAIAAEIGVDDRDPRIEWRYGQVSPCSHTDIGVLVEVTVR